MRSQPVTVRLHPTAHVSPRLRAAAEAELRRRGVPVHEARLVLLDNGTIELDLTTPQHILTRRGR